MQNVLQKQLAWVQAIHNQDFVPLILSALQRQLAQPHACRAGSNRKDW